MCQERHFAAPRNGLINRQRKGDGNELDDAGALVKEDLPVLGRPRND
jgi:hypothetical protein